MQYSIDKYNAQHFRQKKDHYKSGQLASKRRFMKHNQRIKQEPGGVKHNDNLTVLDNQAIRLVS